MTTLEELVVLPFIAGLCSVSSRTVLPGSSPRLFAAKAAVLRSEGMLAWIEVISRA